MASNLSMNDLLKIKMAQYVNHTNRNMYANWAHTSATTVPLPNLPTPTTFAPKPKKVYHKFGLEERIAGYRVPVIEKKLTKLVGLAEIKHFSEMNFFHLSEDSAIEVLGSYNPLYAGSPKKLTERLLKGAAGQIRFHHLLPQTGLFYQTPTLTGVRAPRMLTSYAGLCLLDHWAKKFPRFAPFVTAYVPVSMRRRICADCVDMVLGKVPTWMRKEHEKNSDRLVKWEARQYRKMVKEGKTALLNNVQWGSAK